MGKGLRAKTKKRMRTVRRQHYYEVEGKHQLQELSNKLHDPTYDFKKDGSLPVNAFLEPQNPNAVFPQHGKPKIIDFRSEKMAGSGFASSHVFRKMLSTKSKKSKYQTIIKTPEELEAERINEEMMEQMREEKKQAADSDDEVEISKIKKTYTVDDLTQGLDKQMKIVKKKKKSEELSAPTKTISKPEKNSKNAVLKQKGKRKKTRS